MLHAYAFMNCLQFRSQLHLTSSVTRMSHGWAFVRFHGNVVSFMGSPNLWTLDYYILVCSLPHISTWKTKKNASKQSNMTRAISLSATRIYIFYLFFFRIMLTRLMRSRRQVFFFPGRGSNSINKIAQLHPCLHASLRMQKKPPLKYI
jgi:hypothetical protein